MSDKIEITWGSIIALVIAVLCVIGAWRVAVELLP